jgi:hypothetical protein
MTPEFQQLIEMGQTGLQIAATLIILGGFVIKAAKGGIKLTDIIVTIFIIGIVCYLIQEPGQAIVFGKAIVDLLKSLLTK